MTLSEVAILGRDVAKLGQMGKSSWGRSQNQRKETVKADAGRTGMENRRRSKRGQSYVSSALVWLSPVLHHCSLYQLLIKYIF